MRHQIEIEDRINREPLTANERLHAAQIILNFEKIRPFYDQAKNYQIEIDHWLKLGFESTDEEQQAKIFEELKRVMIEKLGCKEEWFADVFLRQIREANVEQIKAAEEAQKEVAEKPSKIKKYKN